MIMLTTVAMLFLFIALGYSAKKFFADRINEATLTLLSVYYLQPLLSFWGILRRPFDSSFLTASALFVGATLLVFLVTYCIGMFFMRPSKERSIFIVSGLFGNTGNLGIAVVLVAVGERYVPYASLINLVNLFVCSSVGAYFYSRGSASVHQSIRNVLRLPTIWAGILALALNIMRVPLPSSIETISEIGAHTSICLQLMIFGMFLSRITFRNISVRLALSVSLIKLVMVPMVGWVLLLFFPLPSAIAVTVIVQLLMPLAVNNINFAELYDCAPEIVTEMTLVTSLLFLGILPFGWMVMHLL